MPIGIMKRRAAVAGTDRQILDMTRAGNSVTEIIVATGLSRSVVWTAKKRLEQATGIKLTRSRKPEVASTTLDDRMEEAWKAKFEDPTYYQGFRQPWRGTCASWTGAAPVKSFAMPKSASTSHTEY